MKFPFLRLESRPCSAFPERSSCLRPVIPIHIYSVDLKEKIHYYALLDTGADYNLFHSELAELIGIKNYKNSNEQTMFGIEGKGIDSYFHDIVVEVGGWKYRAYSGFSDFAGVKNLDKMPYGILGQVGFFENFKITFDYEKQEIEIKRKEGIEFF